MWCGALASFIFILGFASLWSTGIYNFVLSGLEVSGEKTEDHAIKVLKSTPDEPETLLLAGFSDRESVTVRSSGYGSGGSFVQKSGSRINLKRGLTLVGLSGDRTPIKLSHLDTCGGTLTDKDALDYSGDFNAAIKEYSDSFGAFLIVGHDSVVCHKAGHFNIIVPDAKLEGLSDINLRQPYIAVIPEGGEVREFLGQSEESISLNITGFSERLKSSKQRQLSRIERVAHAGGGYKGRTYTNSIEALDYNKNKYSFFEIDFSWTLDDEIVCLHDWEGSFERSFKMTTEQPISYRKFVELVNDNSDLEKCTLSTLAAWLEMNPNKRVVTDIKEKNTIALKLIAERYPGLVHRFVPQVYDPGEYYVVKELGFNDVIWTLYRFHGSNSSVLKHLKTMDLYGLTMPRYKAEAGLARLAFKETGVLSYVHTINKKSDHSKYLDLGAAEIYTDWIH